MRIIFRGFLKSWDVLHTNKYEIETLAFEWENLPEAPRSGPIFDSDYQLGEFTMHWSGTAAYLYATHI